MTPSGVVTTFAGNGNRGSQDGTGANAQFNSPVGMAIDSNDNLFISDTQNHEAEKNYSKRSSYNLCRKRSRCKSLGKFIFWF